MFNCSGFVQSQRGWQSAWTERETLWQSKSIKMIVSNPKILQNNLTLISSQIKRKTLYWVSVEIVLIAAHVVGVVFMFEDIQVNTNTNTNRSDRQIFSVTWSWWPWSLPPTWRSASSTCSTSTSAWSSARDTGHTAHHHNHPHHPPHYHHPPLDGTLQEIQVIKMQSLSVMFGLWTRSLP